jgi:hypothetical protein
MTELKKEIEELFRHYETIWDSQDYGRLKDLWDADDPEPFYLAEEQEDWRFGWDAVERYWVPTPGKSALESIRMRYRDIHAKHIAPDLAIAACWVRHDMKLKGPMKATGGDARVMSVFRLKPEGWRFIAYGEGPMSPVLFMHKLYEMNVSPEFPGYNQQAMETKRQT